METTVILEFLFNPATRPFAVAAMILLGLVSLEIFTLIAGIPLSSKLDAILGLETPDFDMPDIADAIPDGDAPAPSIGQDGVNAADGELGPLGSAWDWINRGRVPLLVLLMIGIAAFAGAGYALQGVAHAILGHLPVGLACILASIATVPAMRHGSRIVARFVPRDETYAVDAGHFLGLVATVTLGPVTHEEPGRVRLTDRYGNQHFPWVRSASRDARFETGAQVLIFARASRNYLVVAIDERMGDA